MKFAIIDLGTNSVRFDIYETEDSDVPALLHREKQMIRLGKGVYQNRRLGKQAIQRALKTFDEFGTQIKDFRVEQTLAFATSAVRDSDNGEEFVQTILDRTQIKLRILSGEEEARLIAKGILTHEDPPMGPFALVDIGGGSTEVSLCHNRTVLDCLSFKLGSSRLHQMFLGNVPPQPSAQYPDPVQSLYQHIEKTVVGELSKRQWPPIKTIIGSSGTILAFRRIIKKLGDEVDPFRRQVLSNLNKKMAKMTEEELSSIPGMDWKRVDIMLSGGILLEGLMRALGATKTLVTSYSLRDGILEQQLEDLVLPPTTTFTP